MARSSNIYLVVLNSRPLRTFTVKHECETYLEREWPKCPTNLRVFRMRDGLRWKASEYAPKDITADLYGLKG